MNVMMLLEMAATAMGDRVAVGSLDGGLTGDGLIGDAAALAGRLRASEAEHLVLCDEPGAVLPVSLFGAAWAGVPYVPINYRLADDDLRRLANRAAPALAVVDPSGAERLAGVDGLEIVERDALRDDPAGGAQPADLGDWPMDPDAAAVLLYTSGTSGPPKTALLRHRHLVSYVFGTVEFASAGPEEAHIMAVPPYHIASVAAQLSQVYSGRRIVPLPKFDPDSWIDLVLAQGVTHAMLVPTMLARIVDALDRRRQSLETVRFVSYGGGKSHRAVVERALELFPAAGFSHAYGLTETSSTVCVMGPDDHRRWAASDDPDERARLSSAGRPLPGVEISVRCGDGTEAEAGTAGEIWVRGEQVAGEYAESGSTLDDNGWFRTRDSGHTDDAGYLWVHGRNDDIIIRGGENMSPGEIEDALLTHPAVVDAAAFGVPSREWGEEVAVCVITRSPAPAADDLRELVRARLRSSRVPARVEFVDELPYNDTGKLLRRELRQRFASDSPGADPAMHGGIWPLEELRSAVVSVDFDRLVLDGIAAASGLPAVVVDVGDDPADDLGSVLAALPVVSVAVGTGSESWDLALDDPGPALEGVRANPQAAVVAAQTLRRTGQLGLLDALLVESLAYATLQAGPEHACWLAQRGHRSRRDTDQPRIEVTDDGATVTVTLDRPRLFNLFDAAMRDQLVDVLKALQAGADDRPVVLTGAGGNFCAGGDPAEFGTVSDPATAHLIRSRANAAPWLAAIAHRTTAIIDGACVGAGIELAAFCARVTATDRARFRLPELSMGLIPGAGGTVSIPARIGRQRTLWWLLTRAELDAGAALDWGLVDGIA